MNINDVYEAPIFELLALYNQDKEEPKYEASLLDAFSK